MKIHLQSDLHLEFGHMPDSVAVADVYVLAGDIGVIREPDTLKRYFEEIKQNCEHVIWVLGNHEFYHSKYEESLERAARLAEDSGVHLMDVALGTDNLVIDDVRFWGTTFWTDLNNNDWRVRDRVQQGLNDFYVVGRENGRRFTAQQSYEINRASRERINWDADVIITHHNPIDTPHPRFETSEITYAFNNTGLEDQIRASSVKYWLYGHTHHSTSTDLDSTLVISNQLGYWRETCNYNPQLVLEV